MVHRGRSRAVLLLLITPVLFLNCAVWTTAPVSSPERAAAAASAQTPSPPAQAAPTLTTIPPAVPAEEYRPADRSAQARHEATPVGEPAGCLPADEQAALTDPLEMLARANSLMTLDQGLGGRILPDSWNMYTRSFGGANDTALSLAVDDVQNEFLYQRMLNALHVSGFVTWLRSGPEHKLHILAIPLTDDQWKTSDWAPYIQAYWEGPDSTPAGDPFIIRALKLPPCNWMVEQGYAPAVDSGWWDGPDFPEPDYAAAAARFLAGSTSEADRVARQIDWLGEDGLEAATTMCGPLSWSIIYDAGAFPPDIGGWSRGPGSFWLAKPLGNGRPWSLFPPELYTVFRIREPLGRYDFSQTPLYPGDFLYTYSQGDGFDHMLVVTEVDENGNVYTVTNLVAVTPVKQTTIERVLLLNLHDPTVGIARNQWAVDRKNGRTGHDGFDVFRWAWVEKDVSGETVLIRAQPGDTLGLLAVRWRTPVDLIARYNEISIDAPLSVGQKVRIPPNEPNTR